MNGVAAIPERRDRRFITAIVFAHLCSAASKKRCASRMLEHAYELGIRISTRPVQWAGAIIEYTTYFSGVVGINIMTKVGIPRPCALPPWRP